MMQGCEALRAPNNVIIRAPNDVTIRAPNDWAGGLQHAVRSRPHGGLRPSHRKSTCLTESISGPYVVQIWPRYVLKQMDCNTQCGLGGSSFRHVEAPLSDMQRPLFQTCSGACEGTFAYKGPSCCKAVRLKGPY